MSFAGQGVHASDGEGSIWHHVFLFCEYANCRGSCLLAVSALSCLRIIFFLNGIDVSATGFISLGEGLLATGTMVEVSQRLGIVPSSSDL